MRVCYYIFYFLGVNHSKAIIEMREQYMHEKNEEMYEQDKKAKNDIRKIKEEYQSIKFSQKARVRNVNNECYNELKAYISKAI